MDQARNDRRNIDKKFTFPLIDCDGNQVTFERRSGKERRKNRRGSDVARNIINILG